MGRRGSCGTAWLSAARVSSELRNPLAPSKLPSVMVLPTFQLPGVHLLSFACADLPVTRMQPRHFLIHVARFSRRVSLLVLRSHFNCDKALSLGNSLPAGERPPCLSA